MEGLVNNLKYWRAERPDEWKMDEFIREAEKLRAENEALRDIIKKTLPTINEARKRAEREEEDFYELDSYLAWAYQVLSQAAKGGKA